MRPHVEGPDYERMVESRQIGCEAREDRAEIERLNADLDAKGERMLTLEWRLGEMVALMQGDIDYKKITAGETRLKVMDECRDLLGLKGR